MSHEAENKPNRYFGLTIGDLKWVIGFLILGISFYLNAKDDHKWIEESGKPHIEQHIGETKVNDERFNQIKEMLSDIKSDIKEIRKDGRK